MWTKKCAYLDQCVLRNLMLSFVFTYDPQRKLQKIALKSDVINWYNFEDKQPIWGKKLSYQLDIFTLVVN